jgi:phage/plasmid-like protein (TIGR03299 family)
MAHAIFGERFLGVREPAWHRVGTVIDEPVKPSDAIRMIGLDYDVEKVDLFLPDGMASGYSAIIRAATVDSPDPVVFGIAQSYELVHVTEIVEQLDEFPWPITSAGALRNGAEVFICYDLGDREMLGEEYKMTLAVAHPYAPGTAWRAMLTPVRVVCQNTLVFGESVAVANFAIKHAPGARQRIDNALVLAKAAAMEDRARAQLARLAEITVSADDVKDVATKIWPLPRQPMFEQSLRTDSKELDRAKRAHESRKGHLERLQVGLIETYNRFCDEHTKFAGTGYALYQAAAEWADWRETRSAENAAAESSLIGPRSNEKRKALAAINKLV